MGEACHLPLGQTRQASTATVAVLGGRPLAPAAEKGLGLLPAQKSSFRLLPPRSYHPQLDWVGLQVMSIVYILSPGPPKPPGGEKQEEEDEAGTTQLHTQQLHRLAIPSKLSIKTTKTGALRARRISEQALSSDVTSSGR